MKWLGLAVFAKGLVEVALLSLIGQGVLYVLAGRGREVNVFYKILCILTLPVFKLARLVAPRFVPDRYLGLVALVLLVALWLIALYYKVCLLRDTC